MTCKRHVPANDVGGGEDRGAVKSSKLALEDGLITHMAYKSLSAAINSHISITQLYIEK